ncbi:chlorite dismutase [Arcanobacterium wilhelmae]|uniref:Coproheme decarboxylase n=1 Tax=Arcanobacterium wilhelmae TaxID=1803177 RepID=A0ABT9NB88_9ACTO|nr:hydrogen peroxide-dependent heme synthase [Arcanobacterium wilhelmae]MDP9800984.1 chlorite dismutase [Arcanobacterium wilhelmae]WFN90344.1 chlorite dismutase family protein [Arcanobacterium wilhelmae]
MTHPGMPAFDHMPTDEEVEAINNGRNFTMWSVFRLVNGMAPSREALAELEAKLDSVSVRGFYDLRGYRADADLMMWLRADNPEALQAAYRVFQECEHFEPVWSTIAVHRPAEFNRSHLPGFLVSSRTPKYAAVYPFIRSYDWYLLPDWKRAAIMRNHAAAGKGYLDVVSSTMATFALSDYEWVVSVEADSPERLVDLMYDFRKTEARMHVRQDTPFFTGVKVELADFA